MFASDVWVAPSAALVIVVLFILSLMRH